MLRSALDHRLGRLLGRCSRLQWPRWPRAARGTRVDLNALALDEGETNLGIASASPPVHAPSPAAAEERETTPARRTIFRLGI
jgi:hypothetical protein